ncbi:hypothetical protein FPFC_013950 [Fructobacillus pseudoficulneus]|uniref:Uncharacterized protein n=1 Tax=Fructobacillus pseudoficulneus TaxID=220714 RepID=A0A3F3GW88_9LACO|nr:hypothetical protein [Fructobacillus pseudoficulneus]GAP02512.1 hypothetical protein FPFC_013950 [Fructobacillus pseudoficulneus]SEH37338.1 hypothetical protein SAMN05660469_0464 [Fructobacillus pseudoficulneus]
MNQFLRYLLSGSLAFLGLLAVDFFVAIFNVSKSGTTLTALGIRIETEMDSQSISNVVTGTWTMLFLFIIFLFGWEIYSFYRHRKH